MQSGTRCISLTLFVGRCGPGCGKSEDKRPERVILYYSTDTPSKLEVSRLVGGIVLRAGIEISKTF